MRFLGAMRVNTGLSGAPARFVTWAVARRWPKPALTTESGKLLATATSSCLIIPGP